VRDLFTCHHKEIIRLIEFLNTGSFSTVADGGEGGTFFYLPSQRDNWRNRVHTGSVSTCACLWFYLMTKQRQSLGTIYRYVANGKDTTAPPLTGTYLLLEVEFFVLFLRMTASLLLVGPGISSSSFFR
jgi:hypothetical protein